MPSADHWIAYPVTAARPVSASGAVHDRSIWNRPSAVAPSDVGASGGLSDETTTAADVTAENDCGPSVLCTASV